VYLTGDQYGCSVQREGTEDLLTGSDGSSCFFSTLDLSVGTDRYPMGLRSMLRILDVSI
jgi:hypothetical protein